MAAPIPTFTLYGENHGWPTPDLLHWESIAERSRLHNWIIRPHRHGNLLQMIYVQHGDVALHIDGSAQRLRSPCLMVIPPLCVHGFEFPPDVKGHVLTLAAPLISQLEDQLQARRSLLHQVLLLQRRQIPRATELKQIFSAIAEEYAGRRPLRDWALQVAVSRLLLWLLRCEEEGRSGESPPAAATAPNKGERHLGQFNDLVERHYREHLPLAEYARMIGISLPHLNALCRKLANRSALQVLHDRLLLEAKRNLTYTVMTVAEVSDSLGFSEPAYFTRFFKRRTGLSPQQFRIDQRPL